MARHLDARLISFDTTLAATPTPVVAADQRMAGPFQ
jgi:hypothetical protein